LSLSGPRVVAVLGYSDGGAGALHPICAERLACAAGIATDDDVVVLSGWARVSGTRSEAELMRDNWLGKAAQVILDEHARTTAENAAHVARIARDLGAREVVVVTSRWHAPRAAAAFRWLVRRSGTHVAVASPPGGTGRDRLRELGLWLLLPVQLRVARRHSTSA
jgi:uncharacterized SAM-binding protein YcdF (DUF218 family)